MTAEEGFLARWSRRKRAAAAQRRAGAPGEAAPPVPPAPTAEAEAAVPEELPPIDAIGAETDIRAFLAPNVPAGLARAALRRAWASDPAIRDFVGLSENAWDFTQPDGVPGFAALGSEEAKQLLAQAMGETPAPAEDAPRKTPEPEPGETAEPAAAPPAAAPEPVAVQQDPETTDDDAPPSAGPPGRPS